MYRASCKVLTQSMLTGIIQHVLSREEMPSEEVSDLLRAIMLEKKVNAELPYTRTSQSPQGNIDKL